MIPTHSAHLKPRAQNDGLEEYDVPSSSLFHSRLQPNDSHNSDTTDTFVDVGSDRLSDRIYDLRHENFSILRSDKRKAHRKTSQEFGHSDLEAAKPMLERQNRLFSFAFGKLLPPVPTEDERKSYPWLLVNIFSQMIFFWLWPILNKGYKRTLLPDDLWYLPKELSTDELHKKYRENLESILRKHRAKLLKKATKNKHEVDYKWPSYAIPYALFLTFRLSYTLSCIFLACSFACQACAPLITKKLITYVEYSFFGITNYRESICWTVGAVILIIVNGLLLNHFFHNAMVAGAAAKLILTKEILVKSFRLLGRSKQEFTTGRITSLMSTDLLRIDLAIGFQPLVLCFPIPVTIAMALLLRNVGVKALAGIGLFIISIAGCSLLTSKLFFIREKAVKLTDERISLMREMLNNLKIIKYYAWESAYKENIKDVRRREMKHLFTMEALRNSITAYAVTLPTLTSMVTFVTLWATNSMKSASNIFSSLSLFSILALAVMLLPLALSTGADAAIGFKRCTNFLEAEELSGSQSSPHIVKEDVSEIPSSHNQSRFDPDEYSTRKPKEHNSSSLAIEVFNACFTWDDSNNNPTRKDTLWMETDKEAVKIESYSKRHHRIASAVMEDSDAWPPENYYKGLNDINLSIKSGEFVVITGMIGSGKSSLLNALAGFMKLSNPHRGRLEIHSDLLLCGAPWIQNATIRDNITFGKKFDREFYEEVIYACCLNDDIDQLSHRDLTEIGEKGVTLSGGQKARINLARAVYSNSSILLFDDVLSAVDARVGKHITKVLFNGLLQKHTRIIATHQLSLVLSADKIVFLNGDGSIDVGTCTELLRRNSRFQKLFEHSDQFTKAGEQDYFEYSVQENPQLERICLPDSQICIGSPVDEVCELKRNHKQTRQSRAEEYGKIIEDEDVCINSVSWDVYKKYIEMGQGIFGIFAVPLFLSFVALSTFCQLFTNTWLSFWIERRFSTFSERVYVTIYVILAACTVIFAAILFTMLSYINNKSAQTLNVKATEKIIHVPMSFMDINPLGRVLNRFTRDTDSLDNVLGEQLTLFIFPLATIIGIIVLCICYLPWFAIAVPFLGCAFVFFTSLYLASSREIKRLEAVQRSVVYNNFNEILQGMATIKAYKSENIFIQKNDYLLDRMNEAYFLSIATQRWLCIHLDALAALFALIVALLCVTNQFGISASSTGLLLNYVIQIVGLLSLAVRAMTQVETEMNSVERLHAYAFDLPQESAYRRPEFKTSKKWPKSGYIQFTNVSLRYRPGLPLVLKDLTFGAYPGEKLGICGRTGAGKSSIMMGLYRIIELESGMITIDGINIAELGLRDLRSKLLIIPQDPVLFQGTIRRNLDPFQQCSDEVLWDSLRRSGLIRSEELHILRADDPSKKHITTSHKFHLDQIVEDEGSNFSLGEKQLLALARSLVRNAKILILDEATSSVDYETDAMIQHTIATEFSTSTTLCIAHRLKTILNYDRILVLDEGGIVEKGVPWVLYQENGIFKDMCDKARITADDFHTNRAYT